jgi:hypothetical protein
MTTKKSRTTLSQRELHRRLYELHNYLESEGVGDDVIIECEDIMLGTPEDCRLMERKSKAAKATGH